MSSKRYFKCISTEARKISYWNDEFRVGNIYEFIGRNEGGIKLISDFNIKLWVDPECFAEVFYPRYFIPSTCVDFSQEDNSISKADIRSDGWWYSTILLFKDDPIWSSISLIDNKEKIRARFNIKKWKV